MAAELITGPAAYSFQGNDIIASLGTDLMDDTRATFLLVVSGGPTAGQVLHLSWDGGDITYTAGATATADGLTWPLIGALTVTQYADALANLIRQQEAISEIFHIYRSGVGNIHMDRLFPGTFSVVVESNNMTGIAATATPAVSSTPAGLRAQVQVWESGPTFNDDELLLSAHSPYSVLGFTSIKINQAFEGLDIDLPNKNTIAPSAPTWSQGDAGGIMSYHIRYADKYGTPPVCEALQRSSDYVVLAGRKMAGGVNASPTSVLRHNYFVNDKTEPFIKRNAPTQPDWVYWFPRPAALDGSTYYVQVLVMWSDGSTQLYHPWGLTERTYFANRINIIPSGYRQLFLHNLSAPSTDAVIVGYDYRIMQPALTDPVAVVSYEIDQLPTPGNLFLIYTNGVGGMETVHLRGVPTRGYSGQREVWQRSESAGTLLGDMALFASSASEGLKVSTGWYPRYYLDHLQQLFHAKVWIVDIAKKVFIPALVSMDSIEPPADDADLHEFQFTLRSAWINTAFNV